MVQALFPDGDGIFQANLVKNWYEEHESKLKHME